VGESTSKADGGSLEEKVAYSEKQLAYYKKQYKMAKSEIARQAERIYAYEKNS